MNVQSLISKLNQCVINKQQLEARVLALEEEIAQLAQLIEDAQYESYEDEENFANYDSYSSSSYEEDEFDY